MKSIFFKFNILKVRLGTAQTTYPEPDVGHLTKAINNHYYQGRFWKGINTKSHLPNWHTEKKRTFTPLVFNLWIFFLSLDKFASVFLGQQCSTHITKDSLITHYINHHTEHNLKTQQQLYKAIKHNKPLVQAGYLTLLWKIFG